MSVTPALTQIPDVKPMAPPGFSDLVGKFESVWWIALVTAVLAFIIGFASYRGPNRLPISSEFPLLFGGPIVAGLAIWALSYGT